jgi:predicted alpha/beta-fold hydrolase
MSVQAGTFVWGAEGDFHPPRWLRNPHLQSIFSTLHWPRLRFLRDCREIVAASRRELVDCGDGVRLVALRAVRHDRDRNKVRRMAVLLHGWEGSADSPDVVSLAQHLFERDFDVVRLNLRDHGESQHLNVGLFHSCRLAEIVGAVRSLQSRYPRHELSCVGFSLGGNFGLRLGARAASEGLDIAHIVAVCPVIDPARALQRLDHGPVWYRRYLMGRWRRSLLKKSAAWPSRYDFDHMLQMSSLTQMADHFVRRYTDFRSLDRYLRGYTLVGDTLRNLDVDAWLVTSTDDPIIPVEDVDRLPSLPNLKITRTRFGGHCGYQDGNRGPTWLERRIERTLSGAEAQA